MRNIFFASLALSLSAPVFGALPIPPLLPNVYHADVKYQSVSQGFLQTQSADAPYGFGPATAGTTAFPAVFDPIGDSGRAYGSANLNSLKGLSAANAGTDSFTTTSKSTFTVPDLFFGGTGTSVQTSFNVHLDGTFALTATAFGGNDTASANVGIVYTIKDDAAHNSATVATGSGTATFSATSNALYAGQPYNGSSSGMLAGALNSFIYSYTTSINSDFSSDSFAAPVGRNLILTVELDTSASATRALTANVGANALSDFSNTLTFASDKPVFNNDGADPAFTAASPEAGIVQVAPEPTGIALIALAGIVCKRRARRS